MAIRALPRHELAKIEPGAAERGSMLYHGCDFERWTANTGFALRHLGLADFASPAQRAIIAPEWKQARAYQVITDRVERTVASRLPSYDHLRRGIKGLWVLLRERSQPFKFMELPIELRVKVYELLPKMRGLRGRFLGGKHQTELPPILTVCRKIRKEALPVFFSLAGFSESCLDAMPDNSIPELRTRLMSLNCGFPAGMLQHIRRFDLCLGKYEFFPDSDNRYAHLEFRLCPGSGLSIANEAYGQCGLMDESLEKLHEAMDQLEEFRSATSLQGELLVMVALATIALYEKGLIKCDGASI